MEDTSQLLAFAESLISQKNDSYCTSLQRQILISALQHERKTYDQLAVECGYSAKYVKQDVAPKLWQLFSDILQTKVSKSNVRAVLARAWAQTNSSVPAAVSPMMATAAMGQPDAILSIVRPDDGTNAASYRWSKATQTITILLVDDQPQNLRLLSELLEDQGYEVQQAVSGEVAMQAIARERPDLILLDIYLPDTDGYTICQQIKADPTLAAIPIIFISALDNSWDKVKAFSAGGSDYITKPFKVVEVLARVENQLNLHYLRQALAAQSASLQRALQELNRLDALDSATQLANRARFDQHLQACWQQAIAQSTSLTLLLIQSSTADSAGDLSVQTCAQILQLATLNEEAMLCRYNQDTLAGLFIDQATADSEQMVRWLRSQLSDKVPGTQIGWHSIRPTARDQISQFLAEAKTKLS